MTTDIQPKSLMVVPMRGYVCALDDLSPCEWDDPNLRTMTICVDQGGSYGPVIADINCDRRGFVTEEMCLEQWREALATAHMFAAAPDLLAALEDLVSTFDVPMDAQQWANARAAISKATGGAA